MIVLSDYGIHIRTVHVKLLAVHLLRTAHGSREGGYLLREPVVYALKALAASNGPVYRACADSQHFLNLVQKLVRVPGLPVKLIDKSKDRDMTHDAYLKQLDGLRLHTL